MVHDIAVMLRQSGIDTAVTSANEFRGGELAVYDEDWAQTIRLVLSLDQGPWFLVEDGVRKPVAEVPEIDLLGQSHVEIVRVDEDLTTHRRFGATTSCSLHRWDRDEHGNRFTQAPTHLAQMISDGEFKDRTTVTNRLGFPERRIRAATVPNAEAVVGPIDFVVMWVDGSDPDFVRRLSAHTADRNCPYDPDSLEEWRFRSHDELRFALRSIEMYAPWYRNVILVTDHQIPSWLNIDVPRLRVVFHEDFFADPATLPTFNSHAIGSQLHRIPGLSEMFIVFNDDILLNAPVQPDHFFGPGQSVRIRHSRHRRPILPPGELSTIFSARANAADLIEQEFGRRPDRLFAHVPLPQRVSVAHELEFRFPNAYEITRTSRFRSSNDFESNAWLQLNYLSAKGLASESSLRFGYIRLGSAGALDRLSRSFSSSRAQAICINDGEIETHETVSLRLLEVLTAAYPYPTVFEANTSPRANASWPGPSPDQVSRSEGAVS